MKKSLVFLLAGTVGASIIGALAGWPGSFDSPHHPATAQKPGVTEPARVQIIEEKRKVYPYSIVPGGAGTVEEARLAMSNPAVRAHYAAVDLKKLKKAILTADISGYVSYRFGDKIYWTSQTLHLKAGETVFTDGQNIVRGRCLNCYSAHPMMPTLPHEPKEVIMDTSVEVPMIAMEFPHLPLEPGPVVPPPLETAKRAAGGVAPGHGGWGFFPIIPIIPPIHSHHKPPPPPPVPPVTVIPEPRYGWAVPVVVMMVVFVIARKRRRAAGSKAAL